MKALNFSVRFSQISTYSRILITAHRDPDGDACGAVSALALALRAAGCQPIIWLADGIYPQYQQFLPAPDYITDYPRDAVLDLIIVLDSSDIKRVQHHEKLTQYHGRVPLLNLDHHSDNSHYGNWQIVDPTCSSTGELLCHWFAADNVVITRAMAEWLYLSIIYDTGCFRYSNTSAATFQVAAMLCETGINSAVITQQVFEEKEPEYFEHIQNGLANLVINREKGYAYSVLADNALDAGHHVIDFIRMIRGLDIYLVFRQADPQTVRINLRSKQQCNVAVFARQFNGGGHARAAGITLEGQLNAVVPQIITALELTLEQNISH